MVPIAATKTYTTQLLVFAHLFGDSALDAVPRLAGQVIEASKPLAERLAEEIARKHSAYFLGRGLDVVTAKEGALKLKEISYIHAEAYPAGESKHGPISLIEKGFPVLFTASPSVFDEILANAHEMRARGAEIILASSEPSDLADYWFDVPGASEVVFPILSVIPWQLVAYFAAVHRGLNPDRPRNLAKSVTVK